MNTEHTIIRGAALIAIDQELQAQLEDNNFHDLQEALNFDFSLQRFFNKSAILITTGVVGAICIVALTMVMQ